MTLAITVAVLSLAVSSVTAWLTLFRRGTVKMTQPTVIFFGPDDRGLPKVYLRTLLFATSKRGRVIESMHVRLTREDVRQNFSVWVYGERSQLVRGSGLFVGETGLAANHHFLVLADGGSFLFAHGQYRLDVFGHLLGEQNAKQLFTQELTISPEVGVSLSQMGNGAYFDWEPETGRYLANVHRWDAARDPRDFVAATYSPPSALLQG